MDKNNQYKFIPMYLYDQKLRLVDVFKGVQKISEILCTTRDNVRDAVDRFTPIVSSKREYFFIRTKPLEQNSVYVNLTEEQLLKYKYRMNQLGYSNFFEI